MFGDSRIVVVVVVGFGRFVVVGASAGTVGLGRGDSAKVGETPTVATAGAGTAVTVIDVGVAFLPGLLVFFVLAGA